jgi:hypothetical protein
MTIIRQASRHEMLLRFAIGEVNSRFAFANRQERLRTLGLLTSGDPTLEVEGIERQLQQRRAFLDSIPDDTIWSFARLGLSEQDFGRLRTIREDGWINLTGGTQRLVDAADLIGKQPSRDPSIASVVSACKEGRLELRGVTVLTMNDSGPFTIVEGHARLIALYLCCIVSASSPHCSEDLEVVSGLSNTAWSWS